MDEQYLDVNGVRLCYEVMGEDTDPTVVLVMGLDLQLVWWRDDLCHQLVDRGLRVIRFDNRDTGRSTTFPGAELTAWQYLRRKADPVYALEDMADDVGGLIGRLAPLGAHVVGASLGAMVAQEVAIRHPDKVLSLTSVMGRPGDRRSGRTSLRMRLRPGGDDMVEVFRRIGSDGRTEQDDEDVRTAARRSAARGADGSSNQLRAVLAERDRRADLRRLQVPTLVVHGLKDAVIKPSGGIATAAAVPGSELMLVPGMGHDLPRWVWPRLVEGISRTVSRALPLTPGPT